MVRFSRRQFAMSIIIATLILVVVASTVGKMDFYSVGKANEKALNAQITNLTSEQELPAGLIEIRGSATGEKGSIRAILLKVDGGPAVSATPKAPDDFSSWSAFVDVTTSGNHAIEVQVVDSEGKVHSTKQSLTVTEPAPSIMATRDLVVEATSAAGAEVVYALPVVEGDKTDLVGLICSPASGEIFHIGTTIVTCIATHGIGDVLSASFTVSVNDSTPPAIQAPANVISNASGELLTRVSLGFPLVSDIVDANPSVSNDAPSTGFPPGTTSIVWTATDDHGNFAIAVQMVTVLADSPDSDSAAGKTGSGGSGNSSPSEEHTGNTSVIYGTGGGGSSSKSNNGKDDDKDGKHNDKENTTSPSSAARATNATTIPHYVLVTNSLDITGKPFKGMYATIKSSAGAILLEGYSPLTFMGIGNTTYTITVSDNNTRVFDHWEDGATGTTRTLTLNRNITIAAYYRDTSAAPSDTTPPVVTALPLGGMYPSSRSVTLSANEPAIIYFTTNGTTPTTSSAVYSSAINISSTKTLKYFAKDPAGNRGMVVTQTYVIDKIRPSVIISEPAADSVLTVTGEGILVSGTAFDSGSGIKLVEVRLDNHRYIVATPEASGDWSSWGATFSATPGQHRLVSRATDNAGNQAWNRINITVAHPTSPPTGENILRTGDTTNDTFDSVILAESSAIGWPDPMLIKAQISQESDFNPLENTLGTQWASPCGLKPGWTENESQSFGLLQITPACGVIEDDMGLYPAGTRLAGHPILVKSKYNPYWSQSFYNGDFNIHFGMYIMGGHFRYYEKIFPDCTENQYMQMALAAHIAGRNSVSGCGSWTATAQGYIDKVLARYYQFSNAAGYPFTLY
jgi:hypothetical protein